MSDNNEGARSDACCFKQPLCLNITRHGYVADVSLGFHSETNFALEPPAVLNLYSFNFLETNFLAFESSQFCRSAACWLLACGFVIYNIAGTPTDPTHVIFGWLIDECIERTSVPGEQQVIAI